MVYRRRRVVSTELGFHWLGGGLGASGFETKRPRGFPQGLPGHSMSGLCRRLIIEQRENRMGKR